jgi:hypothetical protein
MFALFAGGRHQILQTEDLAYLAAQDDASLHNSTHVDNKLCSASLMVHAAMRNMKADHRTVLTFLLLDCLGWPRRGGLDFLGEQLHAADGRETVIHVLHTSACAAAAKMRVHAAANAVSVEV